MTPALMEARRGKKILVITVKEIFVQVLIPFTELSPPNDPWFRACLRFGEDPGEQRSPCGTVLLNTRTLVCEMKLFNYPGMLLDTH